MFERDNELYYIWAQEDKGLSEKSHSNLYISAMENPWTLKGEPLLLTQPEYDWERQIFWVNEGPSVLERNGHIFLTYSASATDENYCLGMLVADAKYHLSYILTLFPCKICQSQNTSGHK